MGEFFPNALPVSCHPGLEGPAENFALYGAGTPPEALILLKFVVPTASVWPQTSCHPEQSEGPMHFARSLINAVEGAESRHQVPLRHPERPRFYQRVGGSPLN
jgi:hypothetical protein